MKRLNVKLALWLIGIGIFSVVGVYFLHAYQEDRNAEFLKTQAEQARSAGNDAEAIGHYSQYVRHRDDREGYEALAELTVKVAKSSDATRQDHMRAYNLLEEALRRYPDLDEARVSLIDYTMAMRRYADTLDHIRYLQENGSKDTSLELKKAICQLASGDEEAGQKKLYEIVGYNPETESFAEEPPATAKETEAYLRLARILRSKGEAEKADAFMQKMVDWNPDLAIAHLTRAGYCLAVWESIRQRLPADPPEEVKQQVDAYYSDAKAELKRAAELDADNIDGLLMLASIAIQEQDFSQAETLLARAKELYPERADVYLRLAALALAQQDIPKAAADLEAGKKVVDNVRPLLERLIEIQFAMQDLKSAKATLEEMRKAGAMPPEYLAYQDARIRLGEGKTREAMQMLEQARPALERLGGEYPKNANMLLGRTYEILGMPDRQLETYRHLVGMYPDLIEARIGEAAALQAMGRHAEADNTVRMLAEVAPPKNAAAILQLVLRQELTKPEDERDWQAVDKLSAALDTVDGREDWQRQLLKAEIMIAQGKSDEALPLLNALRKEHPKEVGVWLALCKLMTADKRFQDRLPQVIALAEKELGNVVPLQVERIRLIAREGGDDASAKLQELESGAKSYEPAQQKAITALLATAYLQVGDYENGKRCLLQVMKDDPSNAQVRQALFDLGMERQDQPLVDEIVKELRESRYFGSKSPLYKYCQAENELRTLDRNRKNKTGPLTNSEKAKLSEIRKLVDEAITVRGEWAPLWRVRGEIAQISAQTSEDSKLRDDLLDNAISNYQRSLEYSRTGQAGTARRLVTLLTATERFAEANDAMRYLEGAELPDEMRRLDEYIKFKGGSKEDVEHSLEMARADIQKDPENAGNYVWYGQLLEGNGDTDGAEKAFRQAVAKAPQLATAWEYFIRRLASNKKPEEATAAAKQAAEHLKDTPLAVGRLFQRAGDLDSAEKQYQEALSKDPGNVVIMRHLAELYLGAKNSEAASKMLDKIIAQASAAAKDPKTLSQVAWARTQKAQSSAAARDYASTMSAIKLIEQNAQDGKLAANDKLAIVSLLAPRLDEPPSRARAIKLLEEVQQEVDLSPTQLIALGRLYERNGDWVKARDTMLQAMTKAGDNAEACALYAEMLFDHEAYEEARRQVDKAEELLKANFAPPEHLVSQGTRLVRARLLQRDGKIDEAEKTLEGWLPSPLPQNQVVLLLQVAQQAESLKLYDLAEKMYDEYASQAPVDGKLALAAYLGRRGDIEKSFALLEEAAEKAPMIQVLPIALADARAFPEKVSTGQFELMNKWAQTATEQTKDPQRLKLLIAEMYDLQSRYADVIKIYRELLTDKNLPMVTRAIVQNNLAFILAGINPTPQSGAEAQKLIEQAIEVLGPTSDLLDTRALTFLAQGKVDQAAADLRTAVGDRPTTSKYYHLAQVEKKLGNVDAAKSALEKALELKGDQNPFTPAERKGFEQLQSELN